ncbi:MAG: CDP-alcohol phosphatidyltransferase family protein [Saprospiraceae bacterium]
MAQIPNILTLCNLLCGCAALLCVVSAQYHEAAFCLAGAFFFDYADGLVARALGVSSPMGKQLDSLADVVSFGVVPGAMLWSVLDAPAHAPLPGPLPAPFSLSVPALAGFALSAFAAYRLAKFNIDTRQQGYFLGLSTPACTLFVLGYTLSAHSSAAGSWAQVLHSKAVAYPLIAVLSALMVSEIPMFGLKFKRDAGLRNLWLMAPAAALALLFRQFGWLAFSIAVALYILASLLFRRQVLAAAM